MKKHRLFLLLTVFTVMFSFIACDNKEDELEKVRIATPELTYSVNGSSSFSVSWKAVENAVSYVYDLNGDTASTEDLSVTFNDLATDSTYLVKVKAVAGSNSVYVDSEWAEISVRLENDETPGGDEVVKPFEITCDVSGKNVFVQVKPSDKTMAHYSQILSEADYLDYGGEPVVAFQNIVNSYKEIFGDNTFNFLKDVGDVEYSMDMDAYDLNAYVLAAGIDENLNITTEVVICPFKTEPLPLSDNIFVIDLIEIGPAKAVFEITPSNDDQYTMVLMEKDDLTGYTDDDLNSLFSKEYKGWIREHLYSGEMSMTYTNGLFPDTDYILFVFGWDTEPNTQLNKYEFRTEKPVEDSDMTFEFTAEVQGPTKIFAKVVPSSKESLYFTDVLMKSDLDKYGADNLDDYYKNICETYGGYSFVDYMRLFAVTGDNEYLYDYMEPGTEYVLMAVPIKIDGDNVIFYTPQFYSEPLVTPTN